MAVIKYLPGKKSLKSQLKYLEKEGKTLEELKTGINCTSDNIEKEFFGCGGVAHIDHLQNKLVTLARNGFKHHTTVGVGHLKHILDEAFKTYLHYDLVDIDK